MKCVKEQMKKIKLVIKEILWSQHNRAMLKCVQAEKSSRTKYKIISVINDIHLSLITKPRVRINKYNTYYYSSIQ